MKKEKIIMIIRIVAQIILLLFAYKFIKLVLPTFNKIKWYYIILCISAIISNNISEIRYLLFCNKDENKKLFNIYYINYQKVFEICMLISNKIEFQIEKTYKNELTNKYANTIGGEIKKGIFKINANSGDENLLTKSYEYKELQEIKNTNSTFLNNIIKVCQTNDLKELKNGDLIKIDNVELKIINKEELAQVSSMVSGILDGNVVSTDNDGQTIKFDVNALTNILLKDYKYHLKCKSNTINEFYISIPMKAEKEFENDYSIYDLEIGKVNIIGIYRTDRYDYQNNNNTFNYLQSIGEARRNFSGDELISSNSQQEKNKKKEEHKILPYIDIIAIIQDLNISGADKDE